MGETAFAAALTALTGLLFVGFALLSLRSESRLRRTYGVEVNDDRVARANAAVVGLCGAGLCALAGAVAAGVPGRVVGVWTVLASTVLCVGAGWAIRYRDRRDLLTEPDVDRRTARRLGAAGIACGLVILPLAPAIWFGAGAAVVVGLVVVGQVVGLGAVGYAYR